MNITPTNNNQNFGMALRHNNKFASKAVANAEEILKDTKFFHVNLDDAGKCKIESTKDAHFGPIHTDTIKTRYGIKREAGKDVEADNILLINNQYGVGRYVPYGETEPFYNAWDIGGALGSKPEDVETLAKIAKILDDAAVARYNRIAK